MQEPIGTDSEGNEITLIDVLGTDGSQVHDQVEQRLSLGRIRELVGRVLPARERTVIEMRYGLLDGKMHAQHEVSGMLGISRSYVSRIEKRAIQRLKQAYESGGKIET